MAEQERLPVTKESLEFGVAAGAYPLRKFRGRCVDYNPVTRTGQRGPYTVVEFEFDEVKVLPGGSAVPYTMDTGKIGLTWKPPDTLQPTDPWHHLSQCVKDILGEAGRVSDVVGKVIEVDWQKREGRRPNIPLYDADGNPIPGTEDWRNLGVEQFVFVEIDGKRADGATPSTPVASTTPALNEDELFASLADGKAAPDFNAAALQDDRVKNGSGWGTIIQGGDALLAQLVGKGTLTVDDAGVYHKA